MEKDLLKEEAAPKLSRFKQKKAAAAAAAAAANAQGPVRASDGKEGFDLLEVSPPALNLYVYRKAPYGLLCHFLFTSLTPLEFISGGGSPCNGHEHQF